MDTAIPFHRLSAAPALLLLLVFSPLTAEPVATFGVEATMQAVASTPVDRYWSRYPQYADDAQPFLAGRFGLEDESWKIEAEFDFFQQYTGWKPANLPLPDPASERSFPVEYHGLRKGDLVYNFHPLVVAAGRNKVHWGPTRDSLIVADQVPFLDRIELYLPMGDWALESLVASPETRSGRDLQYAATTFQVAHRLSWRQGSVEIGFTEQAILDRNVYGENGTIAEKGSYAITDFLPFFSVHEADVRPFNSMMVFDASWRVGRWRFAFESGFDDFNAGIFGIPDDPIPTIAAHLVEIRWTKAPWEWTISAGNTHYLWGNYGTPLGKSVYRVLLDNGVQEQPLTSPYGPGATWGTLSLRYTSPRLTFDGRAEIWSVLRGVSLDLPYNALEPDAGADLYARARLFATIERRTFSLTTGPQLLYAHGALAEQWYFEVTTSLGSPRSRATALP